MIRLISDKSELSFLPADAYSARITALVNTYGTEQSFAMFWVQTDGEKPVAAISRVDGNMTVCCDGNADFNELSCFINAVGFGSLTCDEKIMEKLGYEITKSSFTVEYKGKGKTDNKNIIRDCDKRGIYDLLCECGFEMGDYHAFLADVCARLNKNTASFASIIQDASPIACAFALFEGDKSVLLGAVATKESARGNGYASKLVNALANEKKDKRVFLFCRNDGLSDFYGKIGFEVIGRWSICERGN